MRLLDPIYQTVYSELAQRSLDAAFTSDFPAEGRFVGVTVKGRKYWYFDTIDGGPGHRQSRAYVGPADDPDITSRVEAFADLKADVRARRKLVSTLVREAHLPRPGRPAGDIVAALERAGFFRLRGVLVGTVAFQAYPAILGARLSHTTMQTGDAGLAQFHSISVAVGDAMPPVLDVLREVDPTFREIPHQIDGRRTTAYVTRAGYRVEFLTPNNGSEEHGRRPASMPALGGAAAQPLRFLDFLIHAPVRAVLLHGAGVPVLVPAPERFAIHKLIVGTRRRPDADGTAKSLKDRMQARALMEAMIELRQGEEIAEAYVEAWRRGPAWRAAISRSLRSFDADARSRLVDGLATGVRALAEEPADFGLSRQPAANTR